MRLDDVLTVLDALERAGVRYADTVRDDAQRLARTFGFGSGEER